MYVKKSVLENLEDHEIILNSLSSHLEMGTPPVIFPNEFKVEMKDDKLFYYDMDGKNFLTMDISDSAFFETFALMQLASILSKKN